MQNLKTKKAMSEIIAVVLLVGITITAVAIFYQFVLKNTMLLSPAVSCYNIQTNNAFEISKVCYNTTKQELQIGLNRMYSDQISSLQFTLDHEGRSESWICKQGCKSCRILDFGETKTYFIDVPYKAEKIFLYASGCLAQEITEIDDC